MPAREREREEDGGSQEREHDDGRSRISNCGGLDLARKYTWMDASAPAEIDRWRCKI